MRESHRVWQCSSGFCSLPAARTHVRPLTAKPEKLAPQVFSKRPLPARWLLRRGVVRSCIIALEHDMLELTDAEIRMEIRENDQT